MAYNFLYTASVHFLDTYHNFIGVGYTLLAIPSLYGMIQMIAHRSNNKHSAEDPKIPPLRKPFIAWKMIAGSVLDMLNSAVVSVSIRGKHYTLILFAIETVQIALQTWQAYRTSKTVSNLHINVLYGVFIFANCWSTSIIHYLWEVKRHHPLMARFLSVLTDTILDFTWGVVFQGVLIWRYWSVERTLSAVEILQVVPENADRELRQILVVSLSNFVLSGFPFLTTAMVLHELASLLNSATIVTNSQPQKTSQHAPSTFPTESLTIVNAKRKSSSRKLLSLVSKTLPFMYMTCMMLHGVVILIIAIAATGTWSHDTSGTACAYRLYPWLNRDVVCVGRVVDCTAMDLSGTKEELSSVLESVSPYLLGNLAFTNCFKLGIPANIHDFAELGTIAIRNSTLTEWGDNAAINASFSALQTLQLLDVRVDCIPSGIMKQQFPESLEWVRFEYISGESFVNQVSDAWHSAVFFTCFDCKLTTAPAVLESMTRLVVFECSHNALTTIPGALFVNKPELSYVQVVGNPLRELPGEFWGLIDQLYWLDIRFSNISAIPAEVDLSRSHVAIFAYGSPLCANAGSKSQQQPQVSCDAVSPL